MFLLLCVAGLLLAAPIEGQEDGFRAIAAWHKSIPMKPGDVRRGKYNTLRNDFKAKAPERYEQG